MDYFIQFQLNFFALLVLITLYLTFRLRSKIRSFSSRLLELIVLTNMAAVIIEPLSWIFDGKTFPVAYVIEYFTNFTIFLLGPVITAFLLGYVDYYIFKDKKRLYKQYVYLVPFAINLIMLIINFFYPVYFRMTSDNVYITGDYQWIQYVVIIGIYIYMLIMVLANRHKTSAKTIKIFVFLFLLPIFGMLIQAIEPYLYFSWSFLTLSTIVIYVYLETSTGEKDYLTKLYSRQSYEKHFQNLVEDEVSFSIVIMDLDNFKEINDLKGHLKGDELLVEFSNILGKVFEEENFICRLGGDEFLILVEHDTDIENAISELHKFLKRSDDEDLKNLGFAYGVQKHEKGMSFEKLYHLADQKMYENKNK